MAEKRDYYEILGVSKTASSDEIKSAFRNLARQYHPDVNSDADAEEKFKEINEAFAVLNDPEKRAAYDRYGHAGVSGNGTPPWGDFNNFDPFEIFEQFFGFGGMGGSSRRRNSPRKGQDIGLTLTLDFDEAFSGVDKEISITREEYCQVCKGTGSEPGTSTKTCSTCGGHGEVRQVRNTLLGSMVQVTTCPTCGGSGKVVEQACHACRGRGYETRTIKKTVPIPAGVDNGTQIRLTGEGQPGSNGGPRGNLYLKINVRPHQYFRRKEFDILLDLNINVSQAALGADIMVPTMQGETKLSIPAGTQSGKIFRLRGKGFSHVHSNSAGDQLVVIDVDIPKRLTKEQRELFEKLADTLDSEVHPQEKSFMDKLKEVLGG